MRITLSNFVHKRYFWFYFRKGLFQVFFPILLGLVSLSSFINQTEDHGQAYNYLFPYTSFILFIYKALVYVLKYIFEICAEDIILKKEINIQTTIQNLVLFTNLSGFSNEHSINIIKKIFKLRYSKYPFFSYVVKSSWFLGLDCPILIPYEIVSKLTTIKEEPITPENEDDFLNSTLSNLYAFHPRKYNITPVINDRLDDDLNDQSETNLVPRILISKLDASIGELQKEIFGKSTEDYPVNV